MRDRLVIAIALLPVAAQAAAPRAEIQVALCEPATTLQAKLALQARGAPYETWLFDDDALTLLDRGIRLRLRTKKHGSELTLKVAKQDCETLPARAVPKAEGKCEFDVHGESVDGVVSLTRALDSASTGDLLARRTDVATLLSKSQVRFLRDIAGAWPLPADLRPLGPIANRIYAAERYDVDISTLPDGRRYAEIADKVKLENVTEERDKLMRRLERDDVAVCDDQAGQAAEKMKRLLRN
jgi:hypothetical protein